MLNLDTWLWIFGAVIPLGMGVVAALLPSNKRLYRYALLAAGVIGAIVAIVAGVRNQRTQAALQAQLDRILHNTENLPSESGFLQYDRSSIDLGGQGATNFVVGRPVVGRADYVNRGARPVQGGLVWTWLGFINLSLSPGGDNQVDLAFRASVDTQMRRHSEAGSTVGVSRGIWIDSGTIPTQEAIDGLASGAWRLYLVSSAAWQDEDGKPHLAHSCTWVSNIDKHADLTKTPLAWHNCEISP